MQRGRAEDQRQREVGNNPLVLPDLFRSVMSKVTIGSRPLLLKAFLLFLPSHGAAPPFFLKEFNQTNGDIVRHTGEGNAWPETCMIVAVGKGASQNHHCDVTDRKTRMTLENRNISSCWRIQNSGGHPRGWELNEKLPHNHLPAADRECPGRIRQRSYLSSNRQKCVIKQPYWRDLS